MYTPTTPDSARSGRGRSAARIKLASIGLAGVLLGAGIGIAGSASADSPGTAPEPAPIDDAGVDGVVASGIEDLDGEVFALEITPEDEAVWSRFDECLTENGVPPFEGELADPGEEAPEPVAIEIDDEAIEACEGILDELSDGAVIEFGEGFPEPELIELSPEDEAVFERYDECLAANGAPVEPTDESAVAWDEAFEQASEVCEGILDDLSDDIVWVDAFEGCDLDDVTAPDDSEATDDA